MGFFLKLAFFVEAVILFFVIVGYFSSFVVLPGQDSAEAVDQITLNLQAQEADPIAHVATLERRAFSAVIRLSIIPAAILFVGFIVFIWNTRLAETNPLRESRLTRQQNFTSSRKPSGGGDVPVYRIDPSQYSGNISTSIDALGDKDQR